MWCTTRKPKGSSYTRSLTKLFEHISYRSINKKQMTYNEPSDVTTNTHKR